MSLINKTEQLVQLQNELKAVEVENQDSQGGLAVRTDLRAGIGEDFAEQAQEGWQSLLDRFSSLMPDA